MQPAHKVRLLIALGVGVVASLCVGAIIIFSSGGGGVKADSRVSRCSQFGADYAKIVPCIADAVDQRIRNGEDPSEVLDRLQAQVDTMEQPPQLACHASMHLSGARYVKSKKITLSSLIGSLPQSSSTRCAAGFTHGMISVLGVTSQNAAQIIQETCTRENTLAQRYSCIHGVGHGIRHTVGKSASALKVCSSLGKAAASDCAQGVYHDLFMALSGSQDPNKPAGNKVTSDQLGLTPPRRSGAMSNRLDQTCLTQPKEFQRECWYRLAHGPGIPVQIEDKGDLYFACGGLPSNHYLSCIGALADARVPRDRVISFCAGLNQESAGKVRACLQDLDLWSVGAAPISQKPGEKPLSPEAYRKKTIPLMLRQCASDMPSRQLKAECVEKVSRLSFRIISGRPTLSEAQDICANLSGELQNTCSGAITRIYRETISAV